MKYHDKVWWFFFAIYWFFGFTTVYICVATDTPAFPNGLALICTVVLLNVFVGWYVPKKLKEPTK